MVEKLGVEERDSIDAPEVAISAEKTDDLRAQHTYYGVDDVHAPQLSIEHSK